MSVLKFFFVHIKEGYPHLRNLCGEKGRRRRGGEEKADQILGIKLIEAKGGINQKV